MTRVFIIPSEGCLLRDTDGTIVPKEGKEVALNTYWSRRMKSGDCSLVPSPEVSALVENKLITKNRRKENDNS